MSSASPSPAVPPTTTAAPVTTTTTTTTTKAVVVPTTTTVVVPSPPPSPTNPVTSPPPTQPPATSPSGNAESPVDPPIQPTGPAESPSPIVIPSPSPSPTVLPPNPPPPSDSGGTSIGVVFGSIVGGFSFLVLIAIVLFFRNSYKTRKRAQAERFQEFERVSQAPVSGNVRSGGAGAGGSSTASVSGTVLRREVDAPSFLVSGRPKDRPKSVGSLNQVEGYGGGSVRYPPYPQQQQPQQYQQPYGVVLGEQGRSSSPQNYVGGIRSPSPPQRENTALIGGGGLEQPRDYTQEWQEYFARNPEAYAQYLAANGGGAAHGGH
ncbi:hypothetical protein BDR26DRAFT_871982 [Obelidium mucronatum]|nr:hypothetical protein BDR26DRAFT_871982 [Obelidium mucronatum]